MALGMASQAQAKIEHDNKIAFIIKRIPVTVPREVNKGHAVSSCEKGQPYLSSADRRTTRLLRVNTVCQSTGTFVNLQQINLTPLNFQMILSNGSVQRHFLVFGKDAEHGVTAHLQCMILFCKLISNKTRLTPPKFKIVLSKSILRTFANGVYSDQNTDQGHHYLRPN